MKQTDTKVTIVGYAQSNARVSTLMRNIEALAVAREARARRDQARHGARGRAAAEPQRLNEFTLNFQIKRAPPEAIAGPGSAAKARAKGGKA